MLRTALAVVGLALPCSLGPRAAAPSSLPTVVRANAPIVVAREELARLVPKEAAILVQIQSGDELFQCAKATVSAVGEILPILNAKTLVEQALMGAMSCESIDMTRPAALAVSFDADTMAPQLTYLLPTAKAAELVAAAKPPFHAVAVGDYLVLTQVAGYAEQATASTFALDLPKGVVAVRVDMKKVVEIFRPLIEPILEQIETAVTEGADSAGTGVDMSEMMDMYFEGLRDFLDSAETLSLGWNQSGTDLALEGKFSVIADSPMAGYARREPSGLHKLAAFVDPNDPIVILQGADFASYGPLMERMASGGLSLYPEALRPAMEALFEASTKMYAQMGSAMAMSGGFDEAGMRMRMRMYLLPKEPAKLVELWSAMLQEKHLADLGIVCTAPKQVKLGDIEGTRFQVSLDMTKLVSAFGEADAPTQAEAEATLSKLFGPQGMTTTYFAKGEVMGMVMGGDDAYAQSALAAVATKKPSAEFERALADLGNANPCMLMHVDVGAALDSASDIMALLGMVDPAKKPKFPHAPMSFFGAAEGLVWRGGAKFDLAGLRGAIEVAKGYFPSAGGMVQTGPPADRK